MTATDAAAVLLAVWWLYQVAGEIAAMGADAELARRQNARTGRTKRNP